MRDKNGTLVSIKANGDAYIFYLEAKAISYAMKISENYDGSTAIISDSHSTLKAVANIPKIVDIRNRLKDEIY